MQSLFLSDGIKEKRTQGFKRNPANSSGINLSMVINCSSRNVTLTQDGPRPWAWGSWEGSCPTPFALPFERWGRLETQKHACSFKKTPRWIVFLHLFYFAGRKAGAARMENSFQGAGVWRDYLGQVWPRGFLRSYRDPDVRGMRLSPPTPSAANHPYIGITSGISEPLVT